MRKNLNIAMIGGEFVYENRVWSRLDHERVYARAEEMRMQLRS